MLKRAQRIMREYDPFTGDLITSDMALVTQADHAIKADGRAAA